MERINPYSFYMFGKAIRELLTERRADTLAADVYFDFAQLRVSLLQLLRGDPIPLTFSRPSAQEILDNLRTIADVHYPGGDGTFAWPSADERIPSWRFVLLQNLLARFETLFAEELRECSTYFVPQRGIYHTPSLVDNADGTFPADLLSVVPEKTIIDWRAAGRCLAFNLLSASGFHVARAVEGILEAYYQVFCSASDKTLNSWNDYIIALEKIHKAGGEPAPSHKTLTELRQMKDDYRNPIVHPRVVLSEADARMLFANGESIIIAMAQELMAARVGVQPQLSLVGKQAE